MKRILVALCLLAAPAALHAQACAASPCSATPVVTNLTVKSAVSFTANGLLDFGSITPGSTASQTADGVGVGAAAGVILNANQAVTVTATFTPLTLGAASLPVSNPTCGYSTLSTTNTTNTTLFGCAAGHTSPATGTGATGLYIWLGGEVATTASTQAGNYVGSATIKGVYTAY
jgi:hypothetical protein